MPTAPAPVTSSVVSEPAPSTTQGPLVVTPIPASQIFTITVTETVKEKETVTETATVTVTAPA
jgi:hypothetical protein